MVIIIQFTKTLALQWNHFLHDYYYSDGDNKVWDKENDIFSALVNDKKRILVDYKALTKYDEENNTNLTSLLNNGFSKEVLHNLERELNFEKDLDIEDPTKQYRYSLKKWNYSEKKHDTDPIPYPSRKLKLGFKNIPEEVSLFETTNPKYWGKLVTIKGTIQNIGVPNVYIKKKTFTCTKCQWTYEKEYSIFQKKYKFTTRQFCPVCRSQQEFTEGSDEVSERIQLIVLSEEQLSSSLPITLKCILPEDLVDAENPEKRKLLMGKKIELIGILDSANIPKYIKQLPLLEVLYWETKDDDIRLTHSDIDKIKKFSKKKNIIDQLVKSYCPSIFGYNKVKEALLLTCVGGITKSNPLDDSFHRGNIHVLLIGSPSTAKTTLGKFISNHFPKSRYAVASSSTQAGLGLAMVKDPETENWMVSAGVLPLCHKSVAILDEADKTDKENLYNLDSVMENQVLNVNKAGLSISLPAQTSVVAIANPKMSRWDKYADLKDQIEFSEVTLSRFDLKYAFDDVPDEELDAKICDTKYDMTSIKEPPLNSENLIKYLLFARKLRPKLSKKSYEVLKEYYLKLRKNSQGRDNVLQITPRQFNSLIRITEAYAKFRLSEKTNVADSERAIETFEHYLQTFALDESGQIDIRKAEGRPSNTTKNKYYRMLEIMKRLEEQFDGKVPEDDFYKACSNEFTSTDVERWLKQAGKEGKIYSPQPRFYQVM